MDLLYQAVADAELDNAVAIPSEGGCRSEVINAVIANVLWQMDGDRKTTALKQLQGHIWCDGYSSGQIIGQ